MLTFLIFKLFSFLLPLRSARCLKAPMFSELRFYLPQLKFDSFSHQLVERQVGNHLEGIPYYGPRSEISGPEISNRLVGSKRSNSDSAFMAHESLESLHLMKVFVMILSCFTSLFSKLLLVIYIY